MSATNNLPEDVIAPLANLDEWELDVLERYPDPESHCPKTKTTDEFRNYKETAKRYGKRVLSFEPSIPDL